MPQRARPRAGFLCSCMHAGVERDERRFDRPLRSAYSGWGAVSHVASYLWNSAMPSVVLPPTETAIHPSATTSEYVTVSFALGFELRIQRNVVSPFVTTPKTSPQIIWADGRVEESSIAVSRVSCALLSSARGCEVRVDLCRSCRRPSSEFVRDFYLSR
jgi:hypothetical protein